jgi:type III restriction enzyme
MGLHPDFPPDPYAIMDSAVRWYPGEAMLDEMGYEMLLPPLVHKVRRGVKAWRDKDYDGASATTRALLNHWFCSEHLCRKQMAASSAGISPNARPSNPPFGSTKSNAPATLTR